MKKVPVEETKSATLRALGRLLRKDLYRRTNYGRYVEYDINADIMEFRRLCEADQIRIRELKKRLKLAKKMNKQQMKTARRS